jgi:hypothetical protein
MQVESYINAILTSPKRVTETSLELDGAPATCKSKSYAGFGVTDSGTLLDRLRAVQTLSENEVLEYGCNLYWNGGIRLGKLRKGAKTSVALNTQTAVKKDGYLGDFHVHPYKLKGNEEATIGPSMGDIEGWIDSCSGRVGVFLVFAGKALCISIFRDCTKAFSEIQGRPYTQVDYQRANEHARDLIGEDFNKGILEYQKLEQLGKHMESVQKERELWNRVPTYPKEFSEANKQMNKEFAVAMGYEYFIADTSVFSVVAELVSNRVYQSTSCVLF